jgi:hypothetical protein
MSQQTDTPVPGLGLPHEPAADVATELARAVVTRTKTSDDDLVGLAKSMSLDLDRLRVEFAYLLVVTAKFCIGVGVDDEAARARVLALFEQDVLSAPELRLTPRGLRIRLREYKDALANPHPEFGRAYSVGRTFARYCDASREVAVIEMAARTYMEQLPPMLGRLRTVAVV